MAKKEKNFMSKNNTEIVNTTKTNPTLPAEPAALGLVGLAVAALVIGSGYLGITSGTDKVLMVPWVLFFGATAQLIAGLIDFKRNNIFGATVFTVFAMAMFSISLTLLFTIFGEVNFDLSHYAFGLIAILGFCFIATVASLMVNKVFLIILIVVDIAILNLIFHYLIGVSTLIAGSFLIVTSVLSLYCVASILINTMSGKKLLSMGGPMWKP